MKNTIFGMSIILFLAACTSDKQGSMVVTGTVKGLKKGTLFLQKMKDTLLVSVDSIHLDGINTFSLSDEIESSEIYFLTLDNAKDKQVLFFGDKGIIEIHTKLDKFNFKAEIKGQKNQQLLEEYNDIKNKFSGKRLDLIKAEFEAKKANDSVKIDSVQKQFNSLIRRKYFYTANFAVKNADAEIAPYIALTELFDANIKLLDTVNTSLSKEVKASKYGKELDKYIKNIKNKK